MSGKKTTSFSQLDLAQLARKHDEKNVAAQEFDMRIDANGTWFHQGGEIKRLPLVKLFASILTKLDDGKYWLITPAERGQIEVEDAPFVATLIEWSGEGKSQQIDIITSLGDRVTLGPNHLVRVIYDDDGTPRPYVNIRGGLDALLARTVYYEMAERAIEGEDGRFGVYSGGVFVPLD